MFNNVALDVVIGLVFVYLLYSLLVTIIQEIIANKLSFRAKFLEKAIIRMLEDESPDSSIWVKLGIRINPISKEQRAKNHFSNIFYDHPLIKYLGEKPTKSKPSYLVGATFSKTVIDLLRGDKVIPGEEIRSKIQDTLGSGIIKWSGATGTVPQIKPNTLQYLNSIWADSQGDVDRFRELLENWFNETMDRTTGWYKKYVQFISLVIGLVIAILFNVDTIAIAHKLEKDPKLREQLVQQADAYLRAHPNLESAQKEATGITVVDTAGKTKLEIDAIIANANKNADTAYYRVKAKSDSLLAKADSLLNVDMKKTNEILGLGIGNYEWDICKDCGWLKSLGVGLLCFIRSLFGWIITALALSLGAPFWFDLLNKLVKVRSSLSPAATGDKEKTGDAVVAKIKRVG